MAAEVIKRKRGRPPKVKAEQKPNIIVLPRSKHYGMGLFGNIYTYGNAGKYANRYYTLQDNSQGIDTYSRELIVRWSREMAAQLPIVPAAIDILTQYIVGDGYAPIYTGQNEQFGNAVNQFLSKWVNNCCVRGSDYSFNKVLRLIVESIMVDGDVLELKGQDNYGYPLLQFIPSNRIQSRINGQVITDGEYKGCIVSDAVVYTMEGQPVGYCVQNNQNLVETTTSNSNEVIFPIPAAKLHYDVKYFDKSRGLPSIASAILQAISLQELDRYEMDKIKIQSMIAYIEQNNNGEAPYDLQQTLSALEDSIAAGGNNQTGNNLYLSPNDHAVTVATGPEIKYVMAEGGEIKSFATTGPTNDGQEYMKKLETQVLSVLGIPHQLIYSGENAGGNITHALGDIFRKKVKHYQRILDKFAKVSVAWAVSKAIKEGIITESTDENLLDVFDFNHPKEFTLDEKYSNDVITSNYNNGFCSLNDVTSELFNRTGEETIQKQGKEWIAFYKEAKSVSDTTGIDLNTVIANWKQLPVKISTSNTVTTDKSEDKSDLIQNNED